MQGGAPMPNIKSAKKRVKVTEVKNARNKALKSNLKTMIKNADAAIVGNAANKDADVKLAIKKIDQACAKGLLHKNTAARKKSSLVCKLNKVG
jgi:small subunit ribosomal protein S20